MRAAKLIVATVLIVAGGALYAWPNAHAVPGGVAVLALGESTQPTPKAYFEGQRVLIAERDGRWHAIVGLPLAIKPGEHFLELTDANGARSRVAFQVGAADYETQRLTVKNRRYVDPTAEDLQRFARDRAEITAAFTTWSERAQPPLGFDLPVHGRLSARFGLRRIFNGEPRQPHSGLDIAAPKGTAVRAPAAATVLAIGDYFFNGKTVFLDHGQGLVTMYNHLNRVHVQAGDKVERGQTIAEIGMTGRVTGPHLHWSVSLNDARVDPLLFVSSEANAGAAR